MEHNFNHKAQSFDSAQNIFFADLVYQEIKKHIHDLSNQTIMDFGGGTGLIALSLAKNAKEIILVDISEKMLEQACQKITRQGINNVGLIEQDLLEKPLKQRFDIIIASRVLHHVKDIDHALFTLKNHLAKNGQLFIADYTKEAVNHHGFNVKKLEEKLRKNGFSTIKSKGLYRAANLFQGHEAELFFTIAQD